MEFKFLIDLKLIPLDCKLLSSISFKDFVACSTYRDWEPEEQASTDRIVICDNPKWVAVQRKESGDVSGTYSCNQNGELFRTSRNNKVITKYEFDGNSLSPVQTLTLDNKIKKQKLGGTIMEKKMALDLGNLSDVVEAFGEQEVNTSNAFAANKETDVDAERKKAERKRKLEKMQTAVSANTADVTLANLNQLQQFNHRFGEVIGYVTRNDAKVVASVKNVLVVGADGKHKLTENALKDPAIVASFNKGEKVKPSLLEKIPTLNMKESAPGPVVGAIWKAPKGGIKTIEEIRGTGDIEFDDSKQDLITLTATKDEFIFHVATFFGGSIKESAITHADAEELKVIFRVNTAKNNETETIRAKPVMVRSNRGKLIQKTNYVPAKIYKTVKLSEIRDEETIALANKSLFAGLFNVGTKGDRYSKLDAKSKANVSRDEAGKISSVFFGANAQELDVTPFAGEGAISNPGIPVKEFNMNKNGDKEISKFVVFDVNKPEVALEHLSPNNNKKFEKMASAVTGMTLEDCIKKVIGAAKGSKGSASNTIVSNNQAIKLMQTQLFNGGTQGMELGLKLSAKDGDKLMKELAEIKYQ